MKLALGLFLAFAPAPEGDGVSVRVTVANFYKTADGKLWSSGSWEITRAKGDPVAAVRWVLEPQAKGTAKRDWKGEMSLQNLDQALADLKKKGLFTAKDSQPCLCDAPQFKMTAKEGKTEHAFKFGHGHGDHDQEQKALVDGFLKLVEEHVTESSGK